MTYPRRASRQGVPIRAARQGLVTRVRSVTDVTGHLREIELTGPDLAHLRMRPGAHLVVQIPGARRVYSIWRHSPSTGSLVLRVLLHSAGGPGCDWARALSEGDRITVEMPRSKITLDEAAKFHLFIGDETGAVPLLAMRAALPATATAYGVFESAGPDDEVPPPAVIPPLPWVHRGQESAVASRVLLRAVQELDLPPGSGVAYVAGESDTCRLIQRHLIDQRGWPRHAVRLQPQWTPGRPGFGAGA